MNPKTWTQDSRPVVWTVSLDREAREAGRAYCLYINGQLYRENMTIEEFFVEWDAAHK